MKPLVMDTGIVYGIFGLTRTSLRHTRLKDNVNIIDGQAKREKTLEKLFHIVIII